MLDIKKILSRSWHILWNYRTLWIFGFILALATGGSSFGNQSNYRANNNQPSQSTQSEWQGLQGSTVGEKMQDAFRQMGVAIQKLQVQYPVEFRMGIAAAITLFFVIVFLGILIAILRYVAESASIRMVDEYEQTGVKTGFRQGWKFGWSRIAWKLFLVDFVVNLPMFVLFIALGLVGWWIFMAFLDGAQWAIISSLIGGIGLAFLLIFMAVILMAILIVLRDFAWRMIVLDGASPMPALRMAAGLARRQWKNIGLMWLVMTGIRIVWGIAFLILVIPLLLVSIFTAVGGVLVAIVPTLLTAGLASLLSAPNYWPWIFAAIIGLPLFAIVAFLPLNLVSGWGLIFQSSTWTLTYRELKALEKVQTTPAE